MAWEEEMVMECRVVLHDVFMQVDIPPNNFGG